MNNHYRKRTPEQVQKKIDRLKTDFMIEKVMGRPDPLQILKRMMGKFKRRPMFRRIFKDDEKKQIRKIKRLERKLHRMENGKWRQGRTGSQTT